MTVDNLINFLTPLRIIFYLFSLLAIFSGLAVVTLKNPVRSVLALVVTFFAMAGVWMLLHAEFLSLILLLVYVGAVMTLFLFVVMMLNLDEVDKKPAFVRYLPFGIIVVVMMLGLMLLTVSGKYFGLQSVPLPQPETKSNLEILGELLFTNYAYPFEIAGVLLLAAIIAAITLAHREPRKRKVQNIGDQVKVQAKDRLRIVTMQPGE